MWSRLDAAGLLTLEKCNISISHEVDPPTPNPEILSHLKLTFIKSEPKTMFHLKLIHQP